MCQNMFVSDTEERVDLQSAETDLADSQLTQLAQFTIITSIRISKECK